MLNGHPHLHEKVKKVKPLYRPKWPVGPVLNSGFLNMKRLGVLLLPPYGMLVHHRVTPSTFAGTICTPG